MKNYIGIVRDHSLSMAQHKKAATKDYNVNVETIREAAVTEYLDTVVSVVEVGTRTGDQQGAKHNSWIRDAAFYSSVTFLRTLKEDDYETYGNTPLYDGIKRLIDGFKRAPDFQKDVTFLIEVFTDGEENSSKLSESALRAEIMELQHTGRWTFVFRVPTGHRKDVSNLGVPEGNILEWGRTTRELEISTHITQSAIRTHYTGLASGQRSTQGFYSNLSGVTTNQVKATMKDISSDVVIWPVGSKDHKTWVQHFVEKRLPNESYIKGAAFYQLMKPEKIQDHKQIMIRDKNTGAVYAGHAARQMLGLPDFGEVRVRPGDHGNFDLFVQSTSCNRHLVEGTSLVYWKGFMKVAA